MRLLSAIHRWAGGLIGLLLALLGLSGAILVWEGSWVSLPGAADPLAEDPAAIAAISARAADRGDLSRITFASEEIGLHHAVFRDGGGAYVAQGGETVARWSSDWQRPELWLFDLHHHLFAGETGELVTGIAGIAGIAFVVTGLILWWRGKRRIRLRAWPERLAPGPIVRHHRDLGVVVAPLLLLSFVTGVLMIFDPLSEALIGRQERPEAALPQYRPDSLGPVASAIRQSADRFPDARLRRLSLPANPGDPILVRMRQPAEWTPNGRTQLGFDARDGRPLTVNDPLAGNRSAAIAEKLYPLHSAKVGGVAMKLAMTVSGVALAMLGGLATYSFWLRRAGARSRRRKTRSAASVAAAYSLPKRCSNPSSSPRAR